MLLLMLFALVAGAGTAITPCVLPVVPALLSASATGGRRRRRPRLRLRSLRGSHPGSRDIGQRLERRVGAGGGGGGRVLRRARRGDAHIRPRRPLGASPRAPCSP